MNTHIININFISLLANQKSVRLSSMLVQQYHRIWWFTSGNKFVDPTGPTKMLLHRGQQKRWFTGANKNVEIMYTLLIDFSTHIIVAVRWELAYYHQTKLIIIKVRLLLLWNTAQATYDMPKVVVRRKILVCQLPLGVTPHIFRKISAVSL